MWHFIWHGHWPKWNHWTQYGTFGQIRSCIVCGAVKYRDIF